MRVTKGKFNRFVLVLIPTHMITRALEDLKKTLGVWRKFDPITMIQNHLKIKDYLFDTYGKSLQVI